MTFVKSSISFAEALDLAKRYKKSPTFWNGCSWMVENYTRIPEWQARDLAMLPGVKVLFAGSRGSRGPEIVVQD